MGYLEFVDLLLDSAEGPPRHHQVAAAVTIVLLWLIAAALTGGADIVSTWCAAG